MEKKIIEICEGLCCKQITCQEELILSGVLDSFKLLELICRLEGEFGITFLPEEISEVENFSTVENIAAIVKGKTKKA